MAGVVKVHYGECRPICFLYCPTTLKAWQALYLRDIYGVIRICFLVFFRGFCFFNFFMFFGNPCNSHNSTFWSKICTFSVTSGSPLGAFGAPLGAFWWTRWPKGSKKCPKSDPTAPRLPKKAPKRRNAESFSISLTFLLQLSYFISSWLLFGSYWRLLAPIGSSWLLLPSICSYCFLLSPIASSLLLLSPIGS